MKERINGPTKAHLLRGAFYLLSLLAVCVIPVTLAQRITAKGNRPANVITVTNTNDSGPGSLRQALADANDGDTINFDPSVNVVTLTTAELAITKSIAISATPQMVTVQRALQAPQFRIFHVMPGHSVTIEDLHITGGGSTGFEGGAVLNDHSALTVSNCSLTANNSTAGGAIASDGIEGSAALAVLNSSITANHADFEGGGIYDNSGTLTITNSVLSNNTAAYSSFGSAYGQGGGIYKYAGVLTITGSVISNNLAGVTDPIPAGTGGGVAGYGTQLTITNSTISYNQSYLAGGGIDGGPMTITNSTLSGNRTSSFHDGLPYGRGGGISGTVTLNNSTLSGNYAEVSGGAIDGGGNITNSTISGNNGGGIFVTGALEVGDTILNAGTPVNISGVGTVTSHGYNVCSDNGGGHLNGPGDQINTNPLLGPLQDNGGRTFTHELVTGSPAINAGDPSFTPPPLYDQRGSPFVRVFNGRIDIGSFEVQPLLRPTPTPRSRPTPKPRPTH